MKSGFAIGMLALRALRDVAPDLFAKRRLGFVAVVEEECTGNGTLRSIAENRVVADEVVVLEPTDLGLMLGGVGVLWIEIEVFRVGGPRLRRRRRIRARSRSACGSSTGCGPGRQRSRRPSRSRALRVEPNALQPQSWEGRGRRLDFERAGASARFGVRVGFPRAGRRTKPKQSVREVVADCCIERRVANSAQGDFDRLQGAWLSARRESRSRARFRHRPSPSARERSADVHAGRAPPMHASISTTSTFRRSASARSRTTSTAVDESVELQSIVDAARTLARFLLIRFGGDEAPT